MADQDIALMAHLMRRAGFGATREELEARVANGYEATVEKLLNPGGQQAVDRYEFLRYQPGFLRPVTSPGMGSSTWLYHLLNTQRPLLEKMVLFWHQVFATGQSKIDNYNELIIQTDMFREKGIGNYRDLLVDLARDPAMIFWLDNCDNHSYAVNENWGRELLELFSMGVSNYTELDVRECSRAFTGWTIKPKLSRFPYSRFDWEFEYRDEDHDDGEKTFLGHSGRFNGEDIINIVCQQPSTARFIARHMYNFFVADEAQVPAWSVTPARDPAAIDALETAFIESGYEVLPMLRTLFLSDFFKEARFAKIKSPAEVVVGTLRMVGGAEFPAPGIGEMSRQTGYMGQDMLNPPSVEGWHTGVEWINSGSLMRRVNFAADMVGDVSRPGIQSIVGRIRGQGDVSSEGFVDSCLDLMGPLEVGQGTRQQLVDHANETGGLRWGADSDVATSTQRISEMLQLIVSLREYQYG